MSTNEPRSIHAAEDWGVVLQSVPSKNKKEIVDYGRDQTISERHKEYPASYFRGRDIPCQQDQEGR